MASLHWIPLRELGPLFLCSGRGNTQNNPRSTRSKLSAKIPTPLPRGIERQALVLSLRTMRDSRIFGDNPRKGDTSLSGPNPPIPNLPQSSQSPPIPPSEDPIAKKRRKKRTTTPIGLCFGLHHLGISDDLLQQQLHTVGPFALLVAAEGLGFVLPRGEKTSGQNLR